MAISSSNRETSAANGLMRTMPGDGGGAEGVSSPEVGGRLTLECFQVRAENEPARVDHVAQPFLQLAEKWGVLCPDVNERDHERPV